MRRDSVMIIGAGIVGSATGKGLIRKGHKVVFVDKSPSVVKSLKEQGYSAYLPDYWERQDIKVHTAMFCVDTPLCRPIKMTSDENRSNEPNTGESIRSYPLLLSDTAAADLSNITSAVANHAKWMHRNADSFDGVRPHHLVVIRSTVPPGTTKNSILPLLEKVSGLKAGRDFGLCMQPEFLRTASAEDDFLHPRITVIGEYDNQSGDLLYKIYSNFDGEKVKVDLSMAEFMKYVHNCFNATKISFSNEIWLLGKKLGIDSNFALQLATRSAEGFWNPFYGVKGGRPYDGHCLPKDTEAFLRFAQDNAITMPVLSAVILFNKFMSDLTEPRILPHTASRIDKNKDV